MPRRRRVMMINQRRYKAMRKKKMTQRMPRRRIRKKTPAIRSKGLIQTWMII
jgi:hypothetical protein